VYIYLDFFIVDLHQNEMSNVCIDEVACVA
jgi:hypothetical protein